MKRLIAKDSNGAFRKLAMVAVELNSVARKLKPA